MTDQNSTYRADNYAYPDDDPLAELARIVSGEPEEPVHDRAETQAAPLHQVEEPEEELAGEAEFDLEAELLRELGDEPAPSDVAEAASVETPDPHLDDIVGAEAPAPAELAPEQELDLQEELLAELASGFEDIQAESSDMLADARASAQDIDAVAEGEPAAADTDFDAEFDQIEAITAGLAAQDMNGRAAQPENADAPAPGNAADDLENFFEQGFAESIDSGLSAEPEAGASDLPDLRELEASVDPAPAAAQPVDPDLDFGEAFAQEVQHAEHAGEEDAEALIASLEQDFESAFADELSADETVAAVNAVAGASAYSEPASWAPEVPEAEFPAVDGQKYNAEHAQAYQQDGFDHEAFDREFAQEYASDPAYGMEAQHPVAAAEGRRSGGFRLALGALGLALVAGLGVVAWGVFGDGGGSSDTAPVVVRADTDPVKVKPDEPGGKEIANTDNQVYDSVSGKNNMEPEQKTLVNSRETPLEVTQVAEVPPKSDARVEPQPVAEIADTAPLGLAPKRVSTFTVKPDGTIVAPPAAANASSGSELALAEPVAVGSDAASEAEEILLGSASTGDIPFPEPSPRQPEETALLSGVSEPAPAQAAPPKPVAAKPAPVAQPAPVQAENAPTRIATAEPAPAAAPTTSSEWKVQVASQRSQDAAQASYDNLRRRFASIFNGRQAAIESAQVNGSTFYRVKIPANSKNDANEFCNRLKAAGGSCFVSR